MARKRADFKDNSTASRMNSGDSNDLNSNCIRIDPRTGEKFSGSTRNNPLSFTHVHSYISSNGRLSCFCTVHYVIVDQCSRSLLNLLKLPPTAEVGRTRDDCWLTTTFWVPVCISYSDVIYTHAKLTYCEASRKACRLSDLRSLIIILIVGQG